MTSSCGLLLFGLLVVLSRFVVFGFLVVVGLFIVRARRFAGGTGAGAALRDQRRERIGKRERLAVRVGQERIGKGQLRVARRLDAEGKHGEAAIGLDGGGGRRCEDRADAVPRCVRVARGEHTGNERAVFNARAFDNGIVVAQTELHGGKTCVAGQLRRDGKGLSNVRQLVRGCELERRACGAGKRRQQLHRQQQCDAYGQYSVAFHSSHSSSSRSDVQSG